MIKRSSPLQSLSTETMKNNTIWFETFLYLGIGIVFLVFAAGIVAISNPNIEAKCAERGGQVLVRPGHISSCLYPAVK
jgi:hypothetical protein